MTAEVDKLMADTKPGGRTSVRPGDRVYAAATPTTINDLEQALASGDPYGIPELLKAGVLFRLAAGTLVQVIDRDDNGLSEHTAEMIHSFTKHVDRMA